MLSLIITLFICLFSFCPINNQLIEHKENVVNIDSSSPSIKNTIVYDNHTGYATGCYEFANSVAWYNIEDTFSTVWSDFTTDYGSFNYSYNVNTVNGLYFLNLAITGNSSYEDLNSYALNNSGFKVNRITLFNRLFSLWSTSPSVNAYDYFAHAIQFKLVNGYLVDLRIRNMNGGAFSAQYTLYDSNNQKIELENPYYYGFFCQDNFTFGDVFKVPSIDDIWNGTELNYNEGYRNGYQTGLDIGDGAGYDRGFSEGKAEGIQEGYADGLVDADYDSTAMTIFTGILDIGLLPVNVFLQMLNFEVFGINISGFVSGLLTVSIVIIIIRFLFGGKNDK